MANQILAGAVFQAGQVLAGVDADNILDTFIAPPPPAEPYVVQDDISTNPPTINTSYGFYPVDEAAGHTINDYSFLHYGNQTGSIFLQKGDWTVVGDNAGNDEDSYLDIYYQNERNTKTYAWTHATDILGGGQGPINRLRPLSTILTETHIFVTAVQYTSPNTTTVYKVNLSSGVVEDTYVFSNWNSSITAGLHISDDIIYLPSNNGIGRYDISSNTQLSTWTESHIGGSGYMNGKFDSGFDVKGDTIVAVADWNNILDFPKTGDGKEHVIAIDKNTGVRKWGIRYTGISGTIHWTGYPYEGLHLLGDDKVAILAYIDGVSTPLVYDIPTDTVSNLIGTLNDGQNNSTKSVDIRTIGDYLLILAQYNNSHMKKLHWYHKDDLTTPVMTTGLGLVTNIQDLSGGGYAQHAIYVQDDLKVHYLNKPDASGTYNSGTKVDVWEFTLSGTTVTNSGPSFIAPSTGGPDEKYSLITSLLPSDHAVYLYDGSGNELVRIPKPNDTGDDWGRKVATNGTKIAITDTYNTNLGSLYIYDMDGSNMVKVTHSDASTGDYFGNSLKMNSTKIIVGAPYAGPIYRQGAIYVYDLDGTNEVKITTSDAGAYDELTGWNGLDVTESKILAGAAKHDGGKGAMYTFDLDGSNEFKFQPSDIDSSDIIHFGYYVAASETKVAVAIISGVYIFDHDGTNEVKVTGEGSGIGAYGNTGVAINDTHIGVTDRNYSGSRGAFYIYDIDGTNEVRVDAPSSVPTSSGYFGTSLTMTSDKIYTGPLADNSAGANSGNVYEYNLDGTGERTLPTPSTFAAGSRFGQGLYIYDSSLIPSPPLPAFIAPPFIASSNLVVGVVLDDDDGNNSGSVYVYDANDLSATPTKLTAFDAATNDQFGVSVATAADKIVVAAHQDDDNGSASGSVYVYDANDLSAQPTKLTAFDGAASDYFGMAVATAADKIVVGATGDDDNESGSGSVYVFDANDLSAQPTKLTAFDAAANDRYGTSVAATSDKIFVGAYYDDDNGSDSGSVYVYDANDLSAQPTKLTAFDGALFEYFGYSVATAADKIVVGAFGDADGGSASGSVYVYDANNLSAQPTKLTAFDGAASDFFGYSIAAG